ncbi:MAG TPA: hypothetical protein VK790_12695 [Solirubrobacteraceae bacterium]|jgi:hypothetical protein|nr:hypothetical protein [Solirubrobacteraceae bacterium]
MKRSHAVGLSLLIVFISGTVAAASAAAIEWLEAGAEIKVAKEVEGLAENKSMIFRDANAKIAVLCESAISGAVGPKAKGELSLAGPCVVVEGLTSVEKVGLSSPWNTTLETVGGVAKDEITEKFSIPGFVIEGIDAGIKIEDTCTKPKIFTGLEQRGGKVAIKFEAAEKLKCSLGGEMGTMVGEMITNLKNKEALSFS